MVSNKVTKEKSLPGPWFILRVFAYLTNKIIAIWLISLLTSNLFKAGFSFEIIKTTVISVVGVFLISSLFDLFIIGELNVKPMTANFEVKK